MAVEVSPLTPAFARRMTGIDVRRRTASLGNRLWHSDGSCRVVPARYSLIDRS